MILSHLYIQWLINLIPSPRTQTTRTFAKTQCRWDPIQLYKANHGCSLLYSTITIHIDTHDHAELPMLKKYVGKDKLWNICQQFEENYWPNCMRHVYATSSESVCEMRIVLVLLLFSSESRWKKRVNIFYMMLDAYTGIKVARSMLYKWSQSLSLSDKYQLTLSRI